MKNIQRIFPFRWETRILRFVSFKATEWLVTFELFCSGTFSSKGLSSKAKTFKFPLFFEIIKLKVPEEIRRLGIHLMFAREPFDNIELFTRALNRMKMPSVPKALSRNGTHSVCF